MTVTFRVELELTQPNRSVTTNVNEAFVATQLAMTSAVTALVPEFHWMFETVTPLTVALAPPFAVITKAGALIVSVAVAICEFDDGLPC